MAYAAAVGAIHHSWSHRGVVAVSRVARPTIRLSGIVETIDRALLARPELAGARLTIEVRNARSMPVRHACGLYRRGIIYLCDNAAIGGGDDPLRAWLADRYFGKEGRGPESYSRYVTEFVLLHEMGHAWNELRGFVCPVRETEEANANRFALNVLLS